MTLVKYSSPANENKPPEDAKSKRRKHRDWSGATFGLLIGAFGLLMARLGYLWIGFDVFSQFFLQFIFLVIASIGGMIVPRHKGLAGSVLFVILIAGYSLWAQLGAGAAPQQLRHLLEGERQLKVASFNTYYNNQDFDQMADEILKLDPDIMTLVEFTQNKFKVLDKLKAQYPYQQICSSNPDCDFVIVSKYPLSEGVDRSFWEGPPFISASLGPDFGNVRIVGVHTTRFPHGRAQFTQVKAFVKYMETQPGHTIIMGDFNATPFSRITATIVDGLSLTRLTNLPTWPADYGFPQLAIDHIFVSKGIRALNDERIGENAGSDHFPITITVGVPKG